MSSTRNKNTPGNYDLEQRGQLQRFENNTFINGSQGQSITQHYAGNGLIMGRMGGRDLAENDTDIESYLLGIGSTNLVTPLPQITPRPKNIQSLHISHKLPSILPEPLQIEANQRFMYRN